MESNSILRAIEKRCLSEAGERDERHSRVEDGAIELPRKAEIDESRHKNE